MMNLPLFTAIEIGCALLINPGANTFSLDKLTKDCGGEHPLLIN
jgi:hypothetical protein